MNPAFTHPPSVVPVPTARPPDRRETDYVPRHVSEPVLVNLEPILEQVRTEVFRRTHQGKSKSLVIEYNRRDQGLQALGSSEQVHESWTLYCKHGYGTVSLVKKCPILSSFTSELRGVRLIVWSPMGLASKATFPEPLLLAFGKYAPGVMAQLLLDDACWTCQRRGVLGELRQEIVIKRCGQCNIASYCSRDCQGRDWALHGPHCATLAGKLGHVKEGIELKDWKPPKLETA